MNERGVSILVATYNGAKYVREQLDSIVQQASIDDEIIILDDGSRDGTIDILTEYATRFPHISVVKNDENVGVKRTFERLMGLATKSIIFLSDQDDVWIGDRKSKMIEALRRDNCIAVLANSLVFADEKIGRSFFDTDHGPNVGSVWRTFLKNNFIGCCMAFRREVLKAALPFPATISMHDWWIGTCAMMMGEVRYLAAPSLLYRRHLYNHSSSARRRWSVVLRDRWGNLLALAVLLWRRRRLHKGES